MDQGEAPPETPLRMPLWLKKSRDLSWLHHLKKTLRRHRLSTVCEEARCPNICECFQGRKATFLIMGDVCTRRCAFCSVGGGIPSPIDPDEPYRLARTAQEMGLHHVVVTSVTRDDLPDKGASGFVSAIRAIRELMPACTVEILTPDFSGRHDLIELILKEKPDVFGHNVEMAGRLYPELRPSSNMGTSIGLLRTVKRLCEATIVKSGFMVGLGESEEEISQILMVLGEAGCDVVMIGQYMRPTKAQVPVARYWEPEFFMKWSKLAQSHGIGYCISGPLVRSSYCAEKVLEDMRRVRLRPGQID